MATNCDFCEHYNYDEEDDVWFCDVSMDEDDYLNFLHSSSDRCPYYRAYDEYSIVKKQN